MRALLGKRDDITRARWSWDVRSSSSLGLDTLTDFSNFQCFPFTVRLILFEGDLISHPSLDIYGLVTCVLWFPMLGVRAVHPVCH